MLPTRFEISVGQENERQAIAAGSATSAVDRHKERLGAASARVDLVGVIGMVDGSPSSEHVSAWLANLTDEEILERMSRLKITHTYEPEIVLRNAEVLAGLRDVPGFNAADESVE